MQEKFGSLIWAIPVTTLILLLVRYLVRKKKAGEAISLAKYVTEHAWVVASAPRVCAEGRIDECVTLQIVGNVEEEKILIFLYFPYSHPDYEKIRTLKFVAPVRFGYTNPPHTSISPTDTTAYLALKNTC